MADDDSEQDECANIEQLIQIYSKKGFEYEEMRLLLGKNHGISLSLSILKRRNKNLGPKRRRPSCNVNEVRTAILDIATGPQSAQVYRSVWHTLQMNGMRAPRKLVADILKPLLHDQIYRIRLVASVFASDLSNRIRLFPPSIHTAIRWIERNRTCPIPEK